MPNATVSSLAETVRRRNERRCQRLLSRSELLDTSDLDWDAVASYDLDERTLSTLVYMRDVEGFTPRYLDGLGGHRNTAADPLVSRFLEVWEAEEVEHSRALDRFLRTYSEGRRMSLPAPQPAPPHIPSLTERTALVASRPVGHVVTAAHMAWGATNELLTLNGYRLLAEDTTHPILATLLSRIAAQESRHYGFYYLQAEWRLAESRLVRAAVPRLLRRAWTPVGVGTGFKRPDEFEVVLRHQLDVPGAAERLKSMDRTIARLPGCADLRLFGQMAEALSSADSTAERMPTDSATGDGAALHLAA